MSEKNEKEKFVEMLDCLKVSRIEKQEMNNFGVNTFDDFMSLDDNEAVKVLSRDLHKKWKELSEEYAIICEEDDWLVYVKSKYCNKVKKDAEPFTSDSSENELKPPPEPRTVKEEPQDQSK